MAPLLQILLWCNWVHHHTSSKGHFSIWGNLKGEYVTFKFMNVNAILRLGSYLTGFALHLSGKRQGCFEAINDVVVCKFWVWPEHKLVPVLAARTLCNVLWKDQVLQFEKKMASNTPYAFENSNSLYYLNNVKSLCYWLIGLGFFIFETKIWDFVKGNVNFTF